MKTLSNFARYLALLLALCIGPEILADGNHPHWWRISGTIINTTASDGNFGNVACFADGEVRVRSRFRNCGASGEEDCPWGIPWGWGQSDSPDWGIIRLVDGRYQATTPWWGPPFNRTDREIQIQLRVLRHMPPPSPGPNDGWTEIALGFRGEPRSGDLIPFNVPDEFNFLMFDGESTQGIWRFRKSVRLELGSDNCDGRVPSEESRAEDDGRITKPPKPPQPEFREWSSGNNETTDSGFTGNQNVQANSAIGLNTRWMIAVRAPSDLVRDFLLGRKKAQLSLTPRDPKIPPGTWALMERFGGTVFSEANSRPRKGRGTPPPLEEEFRPRPPILGPDGREYCDCGTFVSVEDDITICYEVGYNPCEECVCW